AGGFPDRLVIIFAFVHDAKPLPKLPRRLQFVKFGRACPNLRVRFWIINGDRHFQSVMVQPPVAFRQMHLFASRIAVWIGPNLVVKSDCVDNERISLPFADRLPQPGRVGILGKWPPIRPNGAPDVILLKQHKYPAWNLDNLKWIGKSEKPWRPSRVTA